MNAPIHVTARGAEYRPANEQARLLCAIAQSRTLGGDQLQLARRLGFDVVVVNERRATARRAN